jgi:hypothetical protein
MKRSWAAWAVGLALATSLGAALWLYSSWRARGMTDETAEATRFVPVAAAPIVSPAVAEETWTAQLLFPATNERLVAQETPVVSPGGPRARAAGVVTALLSVTPEAPRVAVFPAEVKLGKLLLLEDGTVIVDLRTDPVAEPPQSGSDVELLRVYAVVNTVMLNVEEAKRVVLLWNGVQRPSLAGHVDTGHPLRRRADLEAS